MDLKSFLMRRRAPLEAYLENFSTLEEALSEFNRKGFENIPVDEVTAYYEKLQVEKSADQGVQSPSESIDPAVLDSSSSAKNKKA